MNKIELKAYLNGGIGGLLLGAGIAAICKGVRYLTIAEFKEGVPNQNGKISRLVDMSPKLSNRLDKGSVPIKYDIPSNED